VIKRMWLLIAALVAGSAASAQTSAPPPTMGDSLLAVCYEQRNAAMNWHANAQAQLNLAQQEIAKLRAENEDLRKGKQ
jgi:Skp family chaperone for outer membrane proteins